MTGKGGPGPRRLLVSDLDGTLLGDDAALERFARWYDSRREEVGLVYASGRFYDDIAGLVRTTPLPRPAFVVGGVGSEIHDVDTGEPLPTRVNRVTRNPADAVGLTDRGRIEVGARADIILVDPEPTPSVERVFVGGQSVAAVGSAGSEPIPATRSPGDRIPADVGRPRHEAASSRR